MFHQKSGPLPAANLTSTRRITTVGLLAAVGIALFVFEAFIPVPLPFLKIGLANISSVLALIAIGPFEMLMVILVRVVVGSILVGTFLSPTFVLSVSAALVSAAAMAVTWKLFRSLFSVIGISLIGSVAHVMTQFLVVRYLYVQNPSIAYIIPLLLASSLIGGLVVGWVSSRLLQILRAVWSR